MPIRESISAIIRIEQATQRPRDANMAPSAPIIIMNIETIAPQISPLFNNFIGFFVFIQLPLKLLFIIFMEEILFL